MQVEDDAAQVETERNTSQKSNQELTENKSKNHNNNPTFPGPLTITKAET